MKSCILLYFYSIGLGFVLLMFNVKVIGISRDSHRFAMFVFT